MSVKTDHLFSTINSAEDHVQYALGTMQVYSVLAEKVNTKLSGFANYPGIIALNEAEALIKFLHHCPEQAQHHSLKVSLCE